MVVNFYFIFHDGKNITKKNSNIKENILKYFFPKTICAISINFFFFSNLACCSSIDDSLDEDAQVSVVLLWPVTLDTDS